MTENPYKPPSSEIADNSLRAVFSIKGYKIAAVSGMLFIIVLIMVIEPGSKGFFEYVLYILFGGIVAIISLIIMRFMKYIFQTIFPDSIENNNQDLP